MHIRRAETDSAITVGWGLTAGLIGLDPACARDVARRLAGLGVDALPLHPALPLPDVALVVIGAEGAGGIAAAERRARRLAGVQGRPLVILSRDCGEQVFPTGAGDAPILLRAPLSAVSARVLVEHVALRRDGARAAARA